MKRKLAILAVAMSLTGAQWVAVAPAMAQASPATPSAPASTQSAPDGLVMKVSNEVLDAIRADKSLQAGDISKINQLVDQKVLPYVDFEKMTRLAVGRGWREATPEQRSQLTKEFRTLLTYTYSGALSQISDHKVQLQPFRAAPTDTDVVVRTRVVASKGEPIQLDYRLEKGNGGWKIYDMNILGVWLIENYRNAFATELNNGGVDALVKSLADRNKALQARKS
jgi:phospholipid transport system substrate-binding protein